MYFEQEIKWLKLFNFLSFLQKQTIIEISGL